jgi:phosphatidyl-myo-inositol dimannoside synthase
VPDRLGDRGSHPARPLGAGPARTGATSGRRLNRARRVLVITPDFPPRYGGIQRLMYRLVRNWTGLETRVVTLNARGARQFDQAERLPLHRVGLRSPHAHRTAIALLNLRAIQEARRFHPEVVLSAHVVTSLGAVAIQRLRRVPFVQYLYAQEFAERPRLCAFAIRQAAAQLVISQHTMTLARAFGAPTSRLHLIPPGVDLPGSSREARAARPTVITVSRLTEDYKGHDIILEALPLIRTRLPEVLWVVIGDGPLRSRYQEAAAARGLTAHIRFLGSVSDDVRDAWLDRAHVFAMPSRLPQGGGGEGFGIAYLEAGAHGLPVVGGRVAGTLDAVLDGVTGLLVDPTDPLAVAEAISSVLLDPARAAALGTAGAARARDFAWPTIAARVEAVLTGVMESRS